MADGDRTIQWYPGHMAAAVRRIMQYMALIDVVIEVIDARVPASGSNPALHQMAERKRRLRLLTRGDLAEPRETERWIAAFGSSNAAAVDARNARSLHEARRLLERAGENGGPHRAMVVGVPNSGKSTVINGLIGRSVARIENRAGVTRALQWFRLGPSLELMDTPGVLVPKIASTEAQWKLALVGAVPRARYDPEDVASRLSRWLQENHHRDAPTLQSFASARGFRQKGGEIAMHNAAQSYIKEFNEGTFGRITLEPAPDDAQAA